MCWQKKKKKKKPTALIHIFQIIAHSPQKADNLLRIRFLNKKYIPVLDNHFLNVGVGFRGPPPGILILI